MAKDIEEANKSLLKKRGQNQEKNQSVLQLLQSKIDTGQIRLARQFALRHRQGEDQEAIIELFKKAEIGTFVCLQCKRETKRQFFPGFLTYDSKQHTCSECETKIQKAVDGQKKDDKIKALFRFKNRQSLMIDNVLPMCGVPSEFHKACVSELSKATTGGLSTDRSYFIKGDVGVGKSHMAVVLLRQYLESIKPEYDERQKEYYFDGLADMLPLFIEVPELLLVIRDSYREKSTMSEKEIVDYYTMTPFLVLDDLGVEKASEFSTLMIYLIINRRCTSGKTTIITSNLNLEEIKDRLSDRISSRIKGMCREITVSGNDKRYENKREGSQSERL